MKKRYCRPHGDFDCVDCTDKIIDFYIYLKQQEEVLDLKLVIDNFVGFRTAPEKRDHWMTFSNGKGVEIHFENHKQLINEVKRLMMEGGDW